MPQEKYPKINFEFNWKQITSIYYPDFLCGLIMHTNSINYLNPFTKN